MTDAETDTQSLDRQVAEKLFNWTERLCDGHWQVLTIAGKRRWACFQCASQLPDREETPPTPHRVNLAGVARFSTDIEAAWDVVGAMNERGWDCTVSAFADGGTCIVVFTHITAYDNPVVTPQATVEAGTVPEAICRAALEALEAVPIQDAKDDDPQPI